jgi:hypothetical protein
MPPELYFSPELCGSFETVYENRKRLENLSNLDVWLTKAFGDDHPIYRCLFPTAHPQRPPFSPFDCQIHQRDVSDKEEVDRILLFSQIGSKSGRSLFACAKASGKMEFLSIFFEGGELSVSSVKADPPKSPEHSQYFAFSDGIVAYDGRTLSIRTTKPENFSADFIYASPMRISEHIIQTSPTRLSVLKRADEGGFALRDFVNLSHKIACFASSEKFNIVAVCGIDGRLRIRSSQTGRKVATVGLDRELPTNVLITKRWGLIVVKTQLSIFVCSVNGGSVAKVSNTRTIRQWIAYRSHDGVDFVLYQDSDFGIRYFEAAVPAKEEAVDAEFEVCGMGYSWRADAFILVADAGKVIVFPRTRQ